MSKSAGGARTALSSKRVKQLAWLARLKLTEEESKLFAVQLSNVLNYFRQIDALDTRNIPPTFHVHELTNVLREDKVERSLPITEALRNIPQKEGRHVKTWRLR